MGKDFPARLFALSTNLLGINGNHNALAAKTVCSLPHKLRIEHSRSIDRDLVDAGIEQFPDVIHSTYATANRQRDEDFCRHPFYGFVCGLAAFVAGGNVEKGNLVCTLLIVPTGNLYRITGIPDANKVNTFDQE